MDTLFIVYVIGALLCTGYVLHDTSRNNKMLNGINKYIVFVVAWLPFLNITLGCILILGELVAKTWLYVTRKLTN